MMIPATVLETMTSPPATPPPGRVVVLPKACGAMAKLAATESLKYATNGVRVTLHGGHCTAEATDGRVLGVVTIQDFDEAPALEATVASDGALARQGVVNCDTWAQAFDAVPDYEPSKLALAMVRQTDLDLPEAESSPRFVFGTTKDGNLTMRLEAVGLDKPMHKGIPDILRIHEKPALATISFDVAILQRLLSVASGFADDHGRVKLTIRDAGVPMFVEAKNPGVSFVGCIMPLNP